MLDAALPSSAVDPVDGVDPPVPTGIVWDDALGPIPTLESLLVLAEMDAQKRTASTDRWRPSLCSDGDRRQGSRRMTVARACANAVSG